MILADMLDDLSIDSRSRKRRVIVYTLLIGVGLLGGAWIDGLDNRDAARRPCVAQAPLVSVTITGDCRMAP